MRRFQIPWFITSVVCFGLLAPARAVGQQKPQMLHSRYDFFQLPVGSVSFLPRIEREGSVGNARTFGLLPRSGTYTLPEQSDYCFLVNHRLPERSGEASYFGVAALSMLVGPHRRPVSVYRNTGWSRPHDGAFVRGHARNIPDISVDDFFMAHDNYVSQDSIDQKFQFKWHGWYEREDHENSWADKEEWIMDAWENNEGNMRVDAMLLKFRFTSKQSSNRLVAFCLSGDRRERIFLKVFGPADHAFQRSFELLLGD